MQWIAVYVSMLAYPSAADPQPSYAKGSIVITLDPDEAAVFPGARQANGAPGSGGPHPEAAATANGVTVERIT